MWNKVIVAAQPGTEFGMVENRDGQLVLAVRRAGEPWPTGYVPTAGINCIAPDHTRYYIESDES